MRHLIFLFVAFAVANHHGLLAENLPLYVGTAGDGIYLTQFDTDKGSLTDPVRVATTQRPTFIWIHRNMLYSICELKRSTKNNADGAAIVAFSIEADGSLNQISKQDATGDGPCFVSVSENGKWAAIANYGGGSAALFPIKPDGSIGPASGSVQHVGSSVNQRRQGEPHAHSSRFDPTGRRVGVADLGTDKVNLYDITESGLLTPSTPAVINMPKGSGPRHFVFSPDEKHVLVLGELDGTITSFRYAPPTITLVETISTMADGTPKDAPCGSAEILFHPNGKWVYATNRGPSEIAVFDYDEATAKLKRTSAIPSGGKHPRNFRISPDGRFLLCANQQTDNIVVFAIDQATGALSKSTELAVDKPMCLKFLSE